MNTNELIRSLFSNPPPIELENVFEVTCTRDRGLVGHIDTLSHVEYGERVLIINGERYSFGCLATVCTDPAWQGNGLASSLIRAVHTVAENRVEYIGLFSDTPRFYHQFGYVEAPNLGEYGMVVSFADEPWSTDWAVDLGYVPTW